MSVTGSLSTNDYNFYTDANVLDEVADDNLGDRSGDALIDVGAAGSENSELVRAINDAAMSAGVDINDPSFLQIRNAALDNLRVSGVESLTYQSTIALIEDIEHAYNEGQDGSIFESFNFEAGTDGIVGSEAGEYGFGMSAGLRMSAGGDTVEDIQSRITAAWEAFGEMGTPPTVTQDPSGLILVDGQVANGAIDLLPPTLQEMIMDGALAFGGADGFGGMGHDVENLDTQFGLTMNGSGDDAGFVGFFQSIGSANMLVQGGDGTLQLNDAAVAANKSSFAEYVAQLVVFGGYTFNEDGSMQGPNGETTVNQTEMREKLPMYLALEEEGGAYSGYGFSTIFDDPTLGTTSGVAFNGDSDGLRFDGTAVITGHD